MPLKQVIEKLYERIKKKNFKFKRQKKITERLKQKNHIIRIEFDSLKGVAENWIIEKQTLIDKIAELEHTLKVLKEDSSSFAASLQGKIDQMTIEYEKNIKNAKEDKIKFQKEIGSEINVHEALQKSKLEYIDVIKKEVILA